MILRLVQIVVAIAGVVAGWFVARDAANFGVLQGAVALLLVTLVVAVVALWPSLMTWVRKRRGPGS